MNDVGGFSEEGPWSEKRMNLECRLCTTSFAGSTVNWMVAGLIGYPFLTKRYLQRYIGIETRFLISVLSAIATSVFMGYCSQMRCERNVRKLYTKKRQNALEEQKAIENNKKLSVKEDI